MGLTITKDANTESGSLLKVQGRAALIGLHNVRHKHKGYPSTCFSRVIMPLRSPLGFLQVSWWGVCYYKHKTHDHLGGPATISRPSREFSDIILVML